MSQRINSLPAETGYSALTKIPVETDTNGNITSYIVPTTIQSSVYTNADHNGFDIGNISNIILRDNAADALNNQAALYQRNNALTVNNNENNRINFRIANGTRAYLSSTILNLQNLRIQFNNNIQMLQYNNSVRFNFSNATEYIIAATFFSLRDNDLVFTGNIRTTSDLSGNDSLSLEWSGTKEYTFSDTKLDFHDNELDNLGTTKINHNQKLYFDGGTDTYVSETAENNLLFHVGAIDAIRLNKTATGTGTNIIFGAPGVLATNATDGFTYLSTVAAVPTGTPTNYSGKVAAVFCSADNTLYIFHDGQWRAQ